MKLALIIPDCHVPYHHHKAYNLMLKIADELKPQEIVFLGDFADFYSVSSHQQDPRVLAHLVGECDEVNKRLDEIDSLFPYSNKVFLSGNHEHRLERYLIQNCPALLGVTEIKFLFKFNTRPKWQFVPYGPNQSYNILGSVLKARHEPLSNSAKATASKALCSLVYGHIHRIEESHIVGLDGTNHVCYSVGWLGDKRNDLVFGYVKNHPQWQLGFGLVYVNPQTRVFYHKKIHIIETTNKVSCVVNGREFSD